PRDAAAPWRHVDVFLVAITASLAGMGLLLIYSATQHKENVGDISATGYLKRQVLWMAIGVVVLVVTAILDYRPLRDLAPVLLVAGARPRHIAVLTLLGVIGVVAVFQLGVLKQYQIDRLGAFLDPKGDTQRSAYNLNQSVNAIAAGGLTGKGLLNGRETNLSYVPEQQTDFIFTVVGEEFGLAGATTLLALFALLVWRTWRAAALARDLLGTLLCVGVLAMVVFQVFENVGMTMGIMPIIGIPLPFLSYGGSATIASFAGIGLVLNVHMRRFS